MRETKAFREKGRTREETKAYSEKGKTRERLEVQNPIMRGKGQEKDSSYILL